MFTKKDNEYWRAFSETIEGDFVERSYWHSPKTISVYKGLEVIFDNFYFTSTAGNKTYESFITRVYCRFTYPSSLKARIEKAGFLNRLINMFSGELYKTQDMAFDKRFHLHTKNPKIRHLLTPSIRQKLVDLSVEGMFIDIQEGIWGDPLPDHHYEIAIYVDSIRLNIDELLKLKILFEQILDALLLQFEGVRGVGIK